jgi:hypothetical protein
MSKPGTYFCNEEWYVTISNHIIHSSSLSEHCTLLLANDSGPKRPKSLCFEFF